MIWKRKNKESMICSTPKPSQKTSEVTGVSFRPPLSPDLSPLDYAIWGVQENRTNSTSHTNVGSLKSAISEEWNKTTE